LHIRLWDVRLRILARAVSPTFGMVQVALRGAEAAVAEALADDLKFAGSPPSA
jgi:hypothetical protein